LPIAAGHEVASGSGRPFEGALVVFHVPAFEHEHEPAGRLVEQRGGSSTVVVADVGGQHGPQVSFTKDQHAVGELSSRGEYEPFGEAVRSRAVRRDPHDLDARTGQDGVERGGELTGLIPDHELGGPDPS
jgi:hypothetical protein